MEVRGKGAFLLFFTVVGVILLFVLCSHPSSTSEKERSHPGKQNDEIL
jgi:hypothetical protein